MQDLQTKTKESATEILRTRNHKITEAARQQYIENVTQEALDASIVRMFRFNNAQVLELTSQKGAFEFDAEKGVDENGQEVLVLSAKTETGERLPMILELCLPCPSLCGP
ncbi:MAG: hypothetical protein V3V16_08900 [Melioribacteraceae bacterium]